MTTLERKRAKKLATLRRDKADRDRARVIGRLQDTNPQLLITMSRGQLESISMPADHAPDTKTGKVEKVARIVKIESVGKFVAVHFGGAKYVVVTIDKTRKRKRIVKGDKTSPVGYIGLCFATMTEAYDYAVANDGELWCNGRDRAGRKIGKVYPFYDKPNYPEGDKDSRKGIDRDGRILDTHDYRPKRQYRFDGKIIQTPESFYTVAPVLPKRLQPSAVGWPVTPISGDEAYSRQSKKDRTISY